MSTLHKKRKIDSLDSAGDVPLKKRKSSVDSERSGTSDDTAALALHTLSALDGHSAGSKGSGTSNRLAPLKKRKASMDSIFDDDHALGLAALGSVAESSVSEEPINVKLNTSLDASSTMTKGSGTFRNPPLTSSALEHLDALGDDHASLGSKTKEDKIKTEDIIPGDDESNGSGTLASSNQRLLLEALMMTGCGSSHHRRDRFESWGGMSDLSVTGLGTETSSSSRIDAAVALAASALHHTGIIGDVTAAANSCAGSVASDNSDDLAKLSAIPSRISTDLHYSMSSDLSLTNFHLDHHISPGIQAFVEAAMASVGDQLAELAGAVEMAASSGMSVSSFTSDFLRREAGFDSDVSSTASPLLTITEKEIAMLGKADYFEGGRPRSLSTSSRPISVDYDAVAAAVDAAQAVTGTLDLSAIADMASSPLQSFAIPTAEGTIKNGMKKFDSSDNSTNATPGTAPVAAPLHLPPIPPSTTTPKDREAIIARARAAAGYVPPSKDGTPAAPVASRPPVKKRAKLPIPETALSYTPYSPALARRPPPGPVTPAYAMNTPLKPDLPQSAYTPKASNTAIRRTPGCTPSSYPPATPGSAMSSASKASSQKWDDMFECLVMFVEDRKKEDLKGASEKEKDEWEWDGNVPTTYKTKDGKALGRWINNQRSAKHKGNLKTEREEKLVGTGLKWSVLSTNSWKDMMDELKAYVTEKTKDGQDWDGNVPTNYRIKSNTNPATTSAGDTNDLDDDKNLGRWINRQRSLFQAGKLRRDRQLELERIGLKWSVLSTTSWESMYETLCEYVEERKLADPNNVWDGNVPANHKTNDNPPKALGRWINRQRSAYTKNKLKQEFVDKLNSIGLKWAVHERRGPLASNDGTCSSPECDDDDKEDQD